MKYICLGYIEPGKLPEMTEELGGILVLEARDVNHAIQLMSQHPGVKWGRGRYGRRPG